MIVTGKITKETVLRKYEEWMTVHLSSNAERIYIKYNDSGIYYFYLVCNFIESANSEQLIEIYYAMIKDIEQSN